MTEYYIGLMSGTSLDGIDAVLVSFDTQGAQQHRALCYELPTDLHTQISHALAPATQLTLPELGELDQQIGKVFAQAALALLEEQKVPASQIKAIGSHGQTLWHQPNGEHPFSWQAGDANQIAELTGITTVADFRRRDMAAGGQGAPLVPAFHRAVFAHPEKNRAIINIGGLANITTLPADSNQPILGFDTGPGNTLIDQWCFKYTGQRYDVNAEWAQQGKVIPELLAEMLTETYFTQEPPKSTGRELFNLGWINQFLQFHDYAPEDVQATLSELSALTITQAIKEYAPETDDIILCGGGARNPLVRQRIQEHSGQKEILSTQSLGVDPDWVEAIAFAWLAKQTMEGKTGNLPDVSGAKGERILGSIHLA